MQVLLQYTACRLIVIQNCRLNYMLVPVQILMKLSNLGAVDGGLGLWLSLGVGILGSVDPNRYPYPNHNPNPPN